MHPLKKDGQLLEKWHANKNENLPRCLAFVPWRNIPEEGFLFKCM
jgi:hypothetical protein